MRTTCAVAFFLLAVSFHCQLAGGAPGDDHALVHDLDLVGGAAKRHAQAALTMPGNPDRGRTLFFSDKRTRCADCHKVEKKGGDVGPELSSIGGKFDRPHLIESLLEPSRQIVEGFRATSIVTRDGRVIVGLVKQRSGAQLTLVDAEGKQQQLPQSSVEEISDSDISLMPEGIAKELSPQEFTDLVAYLETLRSGAKPKPGEAISGPVTLPDEFSVETIATGLTGSTALEVLADGRVLVCEQTGNLRVVAGGQLLTQPMLSLNVDQRWERGLIGVTAHPEFPAPPYIYVCYVVKDPYTHHRISRFTVHGNVALPESEKILLKGDDQQTLGGKVPAGHQGGALHFGPDGYLFASLGEQTAETPSQELDSLLGKMLRIHPDGSIPGENPFVEQTKGKYRTIWARGLRNPFTFACRPSDGLMFINDVGGKYEEINVGLAGANYGWPLAEHGPVVDERFVGPIHHYPQASIAGGDFAADDSSWPGKWRGKYFFADFVHGWIKALDPEHPHDVQEFATGLRRPVDLRFADDGSLYVLLRNAWVIDDKFQPGTGSLLRFRYQRR